MPYIASPGELTPHPKTPPGLVVTPGGHKDFSPEAKVPREIFPQGADRGSRGENPGEPFFRNPH